MNDDPELSSADYGSVLPLDRGLDPGIGPLFPSCRRISGPAFTVDLERDDNLMAHGALYEAPPGSILVVNTGGSRAAVAGGNVCAVAQKRGLLGLVVDGFVRDRDEIEGLGFPVYARGFFPIPGEKKRLGRLGSRIVCGGVTIDAGDQIIADRDGIVVVPRGDFDEISQRAREKRMQEEALTLDQWETQHKAKIQRLVEALKSEPVTR